MAVTDIKKINENVEGQARSLAAQSETGIQLAQAQEQLRQNLQEQAMSAREYNQQFESQTGAVKRQQQQNLAAGMTKGGALYNTNQVQNQLGQQLAQTQESYGQYEAQANKQMQQYQKQQGQLVSQYRQQAANAQYQQDMLDQQNANKGYKTAGLAIGILGAVAGTVASIFTAGAASPLAAAGIGMAIGATTGAASGALTAKGNGATGAGVGLSALTSGLIGGAFGALGGAGAGEGAAVRGATQIGAKTLEQTGLEAGENIARGTIGELGAPRVGIANEGIEQILRPSSTINNFKGFNEYDFKFNDINIPERLQSIQDTFTKNFTKEMPNNLKRALANNPELNQLLQDKAGAVVEQRVQNLMSSDALSGLEQGSKEWNEKYLDLLGDTFKNKTEMQSIRQDILTEAQKEYKAAPTTKRGILSGLANKLNPLREPTNPFQMSWRTTGQVYGGKAGARAFAGTLFRKSPFIIGSSIGQTMAGNAISNQPQWNPQKEAYKRYFAQNGWNDLIQKYGL